MRTIPLEPRYRPQWERFATEHPAATVAHDLRWATVVENSYGHQPRHLMAFDGDAVAGILPLFLVDGGPLGRSLVSSPFLTYGGVAARDDEAAWALAEAARAMAISLGVDHAEVRNDRLEPGFAHTKTLYHTLRLDLSGGPERLWAGLHASARRNVRKAQKAGLDLVEGLEHLDAFVDINHRNMHRLGTPAHGGAFFGEVARQFPQARLLMLRRGREGVGGMLLLPHKDTVHMPWVASLETFFDLRPNNLLYWEAIRGSAEQGFASFDFGRSREDQGTFRFKVQHGGLPVPLYYQYHLASAKAVPHLDPSAPRFRALVAVWRRLPFPLARALGPRLIGWIP